MCLVQPIVDCRSFSSVGIQEETQEGSGLTVVVEVEGGSDPPPTPPSSSVIIRGPEHVS